MFRFILLLLTTSLVVGQGRGSVFRLDKFSDISTIPTALPTNSVVIFSYGNTPEDKLGGTFNYYGGSTLLTNPTDVLPLGTGRLVRNIPTRGVLPEQIFQLNDLATNTTIEARLQLAGDGGGLTLTNFTDLALFPQITNEIAWALQDNGNWHRRTNNGVTNATTRVPHLVHTQWLAELVNPFEFALENDEDLGGVGLALAVTNAIHIQTDIGGQSIRTNAPYNDVLGIVDTVSDLYSFPTTSGTNRVVHALGWAVPADGGGGFFQQKAVTGNTVTNLGTHINSSNAAMVWERLGRTPNQYNPRWFGAKGDDTTDDQPAFQNMFDSIGDNWPEYDANAEQNWPHVHIPQGYYVLGSTVFITNSTDHLHISHDGYSTKVRAGINSQEFPIYSMDFGSLSSKVLIEGGQYASHGWQGSATNSFIYMANGSNLLDVSVNDCWFQGFETVFRGEFITAMFTGNNFDQIGETIMDSHDPVNNENLRSIGFVNNVFFEPGDDALIFRADGTPQAQIENGKAMARVRIVGNEFNRVPNSTQNNHWIIFDGFIDAVVSGNTFNGRTPLDDTNELFYQNGSAVRALSVKHLDIGNNQISDMGQSGLFLSNVINATITGNVMDNVRTNDASATGGLYILDSEQITVTGNSLETTGGHGFYLDSVTNFVVDNNIVKSAQRSGYYIVRSEYGKLGGISVDNNVGAQAAAVDATGAVLITSHNIVVDGLVSYVSDTSQFHDDNLRIASDCSDIVVGNCILEPVAIGGSGYTDNASDTMAVNIKAIDRDKQIWAMDMKPWQGSPADDTEGRHRGWRLDKAVDEALQLWIDSDDVYGWGGGAVTVKLYVANADGTAANNVSMEYVYEPRLEGEDIDNSGVFTSQSFAIGATQHLFTTLTFTSTFTWQESEIGHSLRIRRDGDGSAATDDFDGDLFVMGVELVHE